MWRIWCFTSLFFLNFLLQSVSFCCNQVDCVRSDSSCVFYLDLLGWLQPGCVSPDALAVVAVLLTEQFGRRPRFFQLCLNQALNGFDEQSTRFREWLTLFSAVISFIRHHHVCWIAPFCFSRSPPSLLHSVFEPFFLYLLIMKNMKGFPPACLKCGHVHYSLFTRMFMRYTSHLRLVYWVVIRVSENIRRAAFPSLSFSLSLSLSLSLSSPCLILIYELFRGHQLNSGIEFDENDCQVGQPWSRN